MDGRDLHALDRAIRALERRERTRPSCTTRPAWRTRLGVGLINPPAALLEHALSGGLTGFAHAASELLALTIAPRRTVHRWIYRTPKPRIGP